MKLRKKPGESGQGTWLDDIADKLITRDSQSALGKETSPRSRYRLGKAGLSDIIMQR